ncbi:cobalt ECF transporter T component CbiQ [Sporanaerobium hydrogeniformans]|uniref:Cobalt ECF transporter T component CbiQ n=1 Tax=Sporanaerobium hydrogeniformans TaxID=3072179 RepID=A0AC61DAU7_9FIRM|nr:cobalt ECF transporter T component CbiQ [Sporanaerobium hydrogeniformans]PHV70399.1 cobalt ECF transporter T component CbiQ [Sporanaerobium hydrogeniformans]
MALAILKDEVKKRRRFPKMRELDYYAYHSRLRRFYPEQKVIFASMLLLTTLMTKSFLLFISVSVLTMYISILKGGMPMKLYLKLLGLPLGFLCISVLTLMVERAASREGLLLALQLQTIIIGISKEGLIKGSQLFLKAIACVNVLYFLCLSTPLNDILHVLQKAKLPQLLIEMMQLIYRFIFILMDMALTTQLAQASRLGYKDLKTGLRSMGQLLSTLLYRALKMNDKVYTALEARGYNGTLRVLSNEQYERLSLIKLVAIEVILIGVAILENLLIR